MKANRVLATLFSSVLVAVAAVLLPAPVAGIVRAEEAVAAEKTEDAQEEELTEEAWKAYVAQLESYGMSRAIQYKQAAYDAFMAN